MKTIDQGDGLYIHLSDSPGCGTRVLKLDTGDGEQIWVHADDFMAVQKERDELRREVALINAQVHACQSAQDVRRYVMRATQRLGFDAGDATAMLSLLREFAPRANAINPMETR